MSWCLLPWMGVFLQAAYVRQYLETVRQRQAELAGQMRSAPDQAPSDDDTKGGAKPGSEGDTRLKAEPGGWAVVQAPKLEVPKPEVR